MGKLKLFIPLTREQCVNQLCALCVHLWRAQHPEWPIRVNASSVRVIGEFTQTNGVNLALTDAAAI